MLLDLLRQRHSCRNFSDRPIHPDIVAYMLACARLSPAGGNEQPWRFGVITDKALIADIARAAGVNYDQSWIASAPLLMVLCTQLFEEHGGKLGMNRFPSLDEAMQSMDRRLYAAVNMEEHQTKLPGEHMVIAALEHGIQSTWISSVDCERVGALLGLEGDIVSNVIAFGYPAERGVMRPKKPLGDIVFYK